MLGCTLLEICTKAMIDSTMSTSGLVTSKYILIIKQPGVGSHKTDPD